jgi:hypothetical protein
VLVRVTDLRQTVAEMNSHSIVNVSN